MKHRIRMRELIKKLVKRCKYCGKNIRFPYNVTKAQFKRKKYCSNECKLADKHKKIECKYCGKELTVKKSSRQEFCDQECFKAWKEYSKTVCAFCGKFLNGDKHLQFGQTKFYCSHKCFINDMGKGFVKYCFLCGKPIYSKLGNVIDYKFAIKHIDGCKKYDHE